MTLGSIVSRHVLSLSAGVLMAGAFTAGCVSAKPPVAQSRPVMMSEDSMSAHLSSQFQGPKANKGAVTHSVVNGQQVLTLSDDFVIPLSRQNTETGSPLTC